MVWNSPSQLLLMIVLQKEQLWAYSFEDVREANVLGLVVCL
jgi:hypothetical protein